MTLSLILQLLPAQSVAYATEAFVSDETGQLLDSGDIQGDAAGDVASDVAGDAKAGDVQGDVAGDVAGDAKAGDVAGDTDKVTVEPEDEDEDEKEPEPTRREYTYEDGSVRVVALLDEASAIPDDAELVVTPVSRYSSGYNYDAYMAALNGRVAGEGVYDDDNTVLYDVAFMGVDENGNTVEYQPEEGAVTVSFQFKQQQLSEGIEAGSAANVEVNHLPLADAAKADTTSEATNIAASDVIVEPITGGDVSATGTDSINVRADSFSVYAFSYTVDFVYDDYAYTLEGEGSVMLSALFAALGINESTADVTDVAFSNEALVSVEQQGSDWQLTSLNPFDTTETLTVTMANGDAYVITVTDDNPTGTNIANYITGWTMYYKETANGQWLPYTPDISLKDGWYLEARATYSLPENLVTAENNVVYYQSPAGFTIPEAVTGTAYDNDDNAIGTIHVDTNGLVTITYNEDFATGDSIDGKFSYWGVIDIQTHTEPYDLDFGGEGGSVHVVIEHPAEEDINVEKTNSGVTLGEDGNYHTTFTIDVTTSAGTSTDDDTITVTDTVTRSNTTNYPYTYTTPTVKKIAADGTETAVSASSYTYTADGDSWVISGLPKLAAGETYRITYDATITDDVHASNGSSQTVTNNVVATSDQLSANSSNQFIVSREIAKTSSGPNANNRIDWTVTINPNRLNIEGCTFTDTMTGNMYLVSDVKITTELSGYDARTIKLSDLQAQQGTNNIQNFEYTFVKGTKPLWPEAALNSKFTIKYTTQGEGDNTAGFSVGGFDYTITKHGTGVGMGNTTKAQAYTPTIDPSVKRLKYSWRAYSYKLPTTLTAEQQYVISDTLSQVSVKDSDGTVLATKPQYTYLGYDGPHASGDPLWEATVKYFLHHNFDIITPEGRYRYSTLDTATNHVLFSPSGASGSFTASNDMTIDVIGIDLDGNETTDPTTKIKGFKIVITPHKNMTISRCIACAGANSGKYYNSYVDYDGCEGYVAELNAAAKNSLQSGDGTGFSSTVTQTYDANHKTLKTGTIRKTDSGAIYIDYMVNIDIEQVKTDDWSYILDQRSSDQSGDYGTLVTDATSSYRPRAYIAAGTASGAGKIAINADYWNYESDNDAGTVRFGVSHMQSIANNPSYANYKYVRFTYSVRVDTDPFWESSAHNEKTYTNTIGVEGQDILTASKSVTVKRETDALDKTGHQEMDPVTGQPTNYVYYDVYINKDAENLDPESDKLDLYDTITIDSTPAVSPDSVTFVDNALRLYLYDEDAEDHKGQELVKGQDWSYTFNPETQELSVNVPDETGLVLSYAYDISALYELLGLGQSFEINNSAELFGTYEKIVKEEFQLAGVHSEAVHRKINVYKVDKDNYGIKIDGATFKLEKYANGAWTQVGGVFTTNENGEFIFDFAALEFTPDTLYRVTELTTKDGYFIVTVNGNPIENYFIIKAVNQSDADALAATAHPEAFTPTADNCLLYSYYGGNMYLENEKIPEIEIPVEKIWNDNDDKYGLRPGSIVVKLLQNGTQYDTATLSSSNNWKHTFENLPKYDNQRHEYAYTLQEVSKPAGYASAVIAGSSASGYTITNTPFDPCKGEIKVKKNLSGRDWTDGDSFEFTLTAGTATYADGTTGTSPMPTGTNPVTITSSTTDYTSTFGQMEFGKAGTYTYTVKETKGTAGGITYDETEHTVTIKVKEGSDGKLVANGTPLIQTVEITNTYSSSGKGEVKVKKTLSGREWTTDDAFEFTLAAGTATYADGTTGTSPMPTGTNPVTITKDTTGYTDTFGKMTFTKAGTYTYTVSEAHKGETIDGVTYDSSDKTITIKVKDDGNGNLVADTGSNLVQTAAFTNTYSKSGKGEVKVKKTLSGRAWTTDDEFEFTLSAAEGTPMPNGTNPLTITSADAEDNYTKSFGTIAYTQPGTYTYTVTETHKGETIDGIAYDSTDKTVTIEVVDDGKGNLVAKEGTQTVQTAEFTNTYSATGTGEIKVKKNLVGRAWTNGDTFTFTIAADANNPDANAKPATTTVTITNATPSYTDTFGTFTFTKPGTYKYTVTESQGTIGGITYDLGAKTITINVKDNLKGELVADAGSSLVQTAAITNTYGSSGKGEIKVKKVIENREWLNTDTYTFTIEAVSNTAGAGVETPMPGTPSIVITSADADDDYTKSFGEITFTKPGAYTYNVTETKGSLGGVTYDETDHNVTIEVVDDGNGNLVAKDGTQLIQTVEITNKYAATGEAELEAIKEISGAEWPSGGSVTFAVTAADGTPMPEKTSVTLTAPGTADFGEIPFVLDDAGKTYTYTITETAQGFGSGWSQNGPITATVTVGKDNGDGTLKDSTVSYSPANKTIINTYSTSGKGEIRVKKTLANREWTDDDAFTFTIAASASNPDANAKPATTTITITKADAGYTKSFGEFTFTKAGTYTYTVNESQGTAGGVTYDLGAKTVTIKVEDDGKGNLVPSEGSSLIATAAFNNTYGATGSAKLEAIKELSGAEWPKGGSVTFAVTAETTGAPMPEKASVTLTAPGTADFGEIAFDLDDAGKTYTYTITETAQGFEDGWSQNGPVTATVTVGEDNGDGTLKESTVTYSPENKTITNTFTPTSAGIAVTKKAEDWGNAESFTFMLAAIDGAPMPDTDTVTVTKANPVGNFGEAVFKKAGTYNYTITELNGGSDGMSYDIDPHTVTVTVTKDANNVLSATVTYDGDASSLTVINTYKPTKATIEATKEFNDWGKADSFEFTLAAGTATYTDGTTGTSPMPAEAVRTATEDTPTASWADIEYRKAGTYVYTVTETDGKVDGVSYDTTPHTVTVTVTKADDATNALTATVSYGDDAALIITNTFTPTKATIEATKEFNDWGKATSFEFTLAAGTATYADGTTGTSPMPAEAVRTATEDATTASWADIEYVKAGTYEYTVTETDGKVDGVSYDVTPHKVTVTVTKADDATNKLSAAVSYGDDAALIVTNTFTPAMTNITLEKVFEDWTKAGPDDFEFVLTAGTAAYADGTTGTSPMPKSGKVDDGPEPPVYYGDGSEGDGSGDAATTTAVATEDAPTADFGEIEFVKAGTYEYTIAEVDGHADGVNYDAVKNDEGTFVPDTHKVVVTVTKADDATNALTATVSYDDGLDELQITNTFTPVTAELEATKDINVWGEESEFTFELTPVDGSPMPGDAESVTCVATVDAPTVNFGQMTYEKAGEYKYIVREIPGNKDYVTYDGSDHEVTVVVTKADDATNALSAEVLYESEGGLTITNVYDAEGEIALEAKKVMKGAKLKAGQFEFELVDAEGNVVQTKSNAADGTVAFDAIGFELDDAGASHAYTVREVIPAGAKLQKDGSYKKGNYTYDGHVDTVKVLVTDNGDGTLTCEATYDSDGATFTNTYTPPKVPQTGDLARRGVAGALGMGCGLLAVGLWLRRRREEDAEA